MFETGGQARVLLVLEACKQAGKSGELIDHRNGQIIVISVQASFKSHQVGRKQREDHQGVRERYRFLSSV